MEQLIGTIAGYLWSDALVYLALGVGLYFTVATKGVQLRYLGEMLRLLREKPSHETGGISPFQAFCMALSGRIGTGNIVGVATAIAAGGPGAVLWMVAMGVLGGASAFAESTLAQLYKTKDAAGDDKQRFRGGIPYYIEIGLGQKWLACIAAAVVLVCYSFLIPSVQSNTIAAALGDTAGISTLMTAVVLTVLTAWLIFGGVGRIAKAADKIVPIMSVIYVGMTFALLFLNAPQIPATVALIVKSAFGMDAVFGGIVGQAVSWGVRRAVFSSAAGAGEATFSSAAAGVSHPVKQGLVQAFSIYVDTVIVCTATGVMILITGNYNVAAADGAMLVEYIPGVAASGVWVQMAVSTAFSQFGSWFVAVSAVLFAFTSILAYYYVAETALSYFDQKRQHKFWYLLLKAVFLATVFLGAVQSAALAWGLGDIAFGLMSYINLVVIVLLTKPVVRALMDYDAQRKTGADPVFRQQHTQIKGADFWQ